MGSQMDRLMNLTRYQVGRLKDLSHQFYLLDEDPECVNVCFWYIPKRLRGANMTPQLEQELGKVKKTKHSRSSFYFIYRCILHVL